MYDDDVLLADYGHGGQSHRNIYIIAQVCTQIIGVPSVPSLSQSDGSGIGHDRVEVRGSP